MGRSGRVHLSDLIHHVVVDVQATRRVDDQYVDVRSTRLFESALCDGRRHLCGVARTEPCADFAGQSLQLQDRSRPMHVDADQHDRLRLLFDEPTRQLGCRRRFARALQAGQHDHDRRLCFQVELDRLRSQESDQLGLNNLDQRLARREALANFLANSPFADSLDERLYDRQSDIRLEERHAHLAQGVLDVGLSQSALAADVFCGLAQAIGQIVEHAEVSRSEGQARVYAMAASLSVGRG